jgi:hypothetical protein
VRLYEPPQLPGDSPILDPEVQLAVDRGEMVEGGKHVRFGSKSGAPEATVRTRMHKRRLIMAEEVCVQCGVSHCCSGAST